MNRLRMITMCMLAMMATSLSVKAQEITVTLLPGWTWISYTRADTLDIATAMGSFTPTEGDKIKSQYAFAEYHNGVWAGSLTQFCPGLGYMYKSTRTMPVMLTFNPQQPAPQVVVTTLEPMLIMGNSAMGGGEVTVSDGTYILVRGLCWATHENPTTNEDSFVEEGSGVGSFTASMTELNYSTTYYYCAYAVTPSGTVYGEQQSFTTLDDYVYVDLGLPSGTLWASCNVGAEAPEDYGDYFAWGETTTKDTYNWSTYQYCMGSNTTLTKYCNNSSYGYNGFTDNLTTLLPEDDAATANWGSDWRMPTKEEWRELYQNTTHTWTTQNGVNGRLFTANNGNSLFLPAAGYRNGSSLYDAGSIGYYWSSLNCYLSYPDAAYLFGLGSNGYYELSYNRNYGQSVRAVRSGEPTPSFMIDATSNPVEGGTVTGGGTYEQGQSCTLTATPNSGYSFTNWTEGGEVVSTNAIYTFAVNADRTLVANFIVSGGGDHAYVDLGLPSGLLWATCNVGADTPEDYGDYFAWGETQPKDTYNWSTYQYCNGGDGWNTLTKYCTDASYGYNGFTDDLITLLLEDDAATANWGSDWRMPTKEEWQELLDNTTVTWTTQNGVNGRLFTASNGSSLFLPAAGYRSSSILGNAGNRGYYWSSSLGTNYPVGARSFSIESTGCGMYFYDRNSGRSVRAVRVGSQN